MSYEIVRLVPYGDLTRELTTDELEDDYPMMKWTKKWSQDLRKMPIRKRPEKTKIAH